MTQLDLFSIAAPLVPKEKKPLVAAARSAENKVVNLEILAAEPIPSPAMIEASAAEENVKTNEESLPAGTPDLITTNDAGKAGNGDIIFEDSRISVKIKSRSAVKKDPAETKAEPVTSKPEKRYGLPSLPELSQKVEPRKSIVTKQPKSAFSDALREKLDSVKNGIKDGLLKEAISEKKKLEKAARPPQKRGRKSFKEIDTAVDLINIPEDEELYKKQYYPISEVAGWFNVNTSLLRFWENEFDILKPRKNRKGDRMFRPEDVKNLQLIYELLRQRKYSIEGAKEFLKTNRNKADVQVQLTQTLQKFRSFLLELKANL